jgi:hypothetical protein
MTHRFLNCKTSSVVQLTKLVHCKLGGCDWDGLHMQCSAISGAVRRMASRPLLNECIGVSIRLIEPLLDLLRL